MSGGKTSALGKEVSGRYVLLPLSKRDLYSEFCGHPLLEQAGIPKRTAYDYEELAGGREEQVQQAASAEKPRHLFLNSADFLKLGVSDAFVIDEAQLESKMRTQSRLQKISTAISLFSMAMSFSVLGLLIVVNQHDGGASIPGGIFGILLGATFLIAACLHLKRYSGRISARGSSSRRNRF